MLPSNKITEGLKQPCIYLRTNLPTEHYYLKKKQKKQHFASMACVMFKLYVNR